MAAKGADALLAITADNYHAFWYYKYMKRSEILSQINGQLADFPDEDLEMFLLQLGYRKNGTSFFDAAPQHVRNSVLEGVAEIEAGGECIPHDVVMADAQRRIDEATS